MCVNVQRTHLEWEALKLFRQIIKALIYGLFIGLHESSDEHEVESPLGE